MRALLIFAILQSAQVAQAIDQRESVCERYLALDNVIECNRTGYLIDFGYRYCQRFEKTEHRYSPFGRVVLQRLRSCLIDSLERTHGLTCQNVKSVALESHVGCYVENGFCGLSTKDKIRIVWTVKKEISKKSFRRTMRQILRACGSPISLHEH